jgi:ATP-dependent DNA helicase RecG
MRLLNNTPVTNLKGVGPRVAELLANLNIYTAQDLLFHLPLHYQDRTEITAIASLPVGEQKFIEGTVQLGQVVYRGRRVLTCRVADATGQIILRLYHFNATQQQQLSTPGLRLRCFGTVRYHQQHGLEMIHPEYRVISSQDIFVADNYLTPIYPTTKGLSQNTLQKLISQALVLRQEQDEEELLPQALLQQFNFPKLQEAISFLHRPPKNVSLPALIAKQHPMQQRLIFEELLAQQLAAQQYRQQIQQHRAPSLNKNPNNDFQIILCKALPFALTVAQRRVIEEINSDVAKPIPMMRLLQGDVGSGKTVVALMTILRAVQFGYQAVFMAPTELLAEQHFQVLQRWLAPLSIKVGWLSGHLTAAAREQTLQQIASGDAAVIVGTHALFQADVKFAHLALVVIDEQHRFGVHQRLALKEKGIIDGCHPHQLIMTATPIPRTLAMTAYADLDISILDELPPGRKPIKTSLISNERRDELIERIKQNCERGRQAYWVCTLIADSEVLQCQAAEATYEILQKQLKQLRIGLLHGRLNKEIKETTMAAFKAGKIDLLVATTVIEVGVDVPNASLMVIENSERLGLSQLHQLRGRVGRGEHESHCVLLYQKPLSMLAKARLSTIRDTQDGFKIAQKDLEIRGPGEWLGTRQAGAPVLRIADIMRDQYLLPEIRQAASMIMQQYPERVDRLLQRWLKRNEQYASV